MLPLTLSLAETYIDDIIPLKDGTIWGLKVYWIFFPVFFKTNYYLFDGQIANSFRPYITFSIGPFIAVDGDETISSFSKKWSSTESQTNLGASLGFGVNFSQTSGNTLSLGLGYDHLNVDKPIHSKDDFGGGYLFLKYQINRE